jgi:putative resolvase
MLTSKKASEKLGVHPNTLRKWATNGSIKYIRTPHGQRLYDVDNFLSNAQGRRKIVYCRVSSRNQKNDLQSQTKFMRAQFPNHECIEDIGSGLNFKRKGFRTLLESIMSGDVAEVIIAYKDRLCRFGFELLEQVARKHNTKLVVLNKIELSPEDELVKDLLAIIHVFSCRLYGLRKYSKQIKKDPNLSKT